MKQVIIEIWNALRSLCGLNRKHSELDEEVSFHLGERTSELVEQGIDSKTARQIALREFGGVEQFKEEARYMWGTRLVSDLWRDIKFGIRQLTKQKVYATIAIATLALAIGVSTAVFSLIDAILLESLPVPNPQELRVLHWAGDNNQVRSSSTEYQEYIGNRKIADSFSHPMFQKIQGEAAPQADIFGYSYLNDITLQTGQQALTADGMMVSDNFFTALQARPLLGRLFAEGDDKAAQPNIIITHDLWRNYFEQKTEAVGKGITISGKSYTIIGILPDTFPGIRPGSPKSFYVSMSAGSPFLYVPMTESWHWFVKLMARSKSGTSDAQLQARLSTAFASDVSEIMENPEILVIQSQGGLSFDRRAYRKPLLLILGVVGMVLLVASANLAGLSLVRGTARQHEISIRAALGANRWRLMRQSLTESLTLALIGGGLGILIANWGATAISHLLAGNNQGLTYDFSLNLTVLGFSLIITIATAFLTGLLPALRASSVDPLAGLKSRGTTDAAMLRTGKALVVAQMCISLALLAGASLYAQSLFNLKNIDAGFDTENLLVFQLNPYSAGYEGEQLPRYYERIQNELTNIPVVQTTTLTQYPLLSNERSSGGFLLSTKPELGSRDRQTHRLTVSDTYFETMRIPILRGRSIERADSEEATKVIVVNETFVQQFSPEQTPIGQVMTIWGTQWRIVGVCKDTKFHNIKQPTPPVTYFPLAQRFYGNFLNNAMHSASFAVRSELPSTTLMQAVQKSVIKVDPNVPAFGLTTQKQLQNGNISQSNLIATLCSGLSGLTLLLSCIGLYGLVEYNVKRRSSEIAIRMAIGAQPTDISQSILRESFILAAIGIAVGLPAAYAVTRYIQSQLYEVQPNDPTTLAVIIATLATIVLVATWIPARRASRTNPLAALRGE